MSRNHLVLTSLLAGLALASVIYLIGFTGSEKSGPAASDDRSSDERPSRERPAGDQPSGEGEAAPRSSVPPLSAREPAEELDDPSSEPSSRSATEPSQMRRTLQQKFGRQLDHPEGPALSEEYVTDVVREQLIPLAQSCYEDIAPKGTTGKMTMSVAVLGDADIGGVIDHVDVDDVDASVAGDLTECVRQAAYAMEFAPPEEGGGSTEFTFSISFSDGPPPERPR